MKPLIGITGRQLALGMVANTSERFREQRIGSYFSAFAEAVAAAGGIPVYVPFVAEATGVVTRLDGIVITGGQDVHPARWGGRAAVDPAVDPRWDHDAHDAERDAYEAALIVAAVGAGTPLLGVCRGHQLLNVVLGGTLTEHLDEGPIVHSAPYAAPSDGDPGHVVEFAEGSVPHAVYSGQRMTNSWHHQAVDRPGEGLRVVGRTPDGVVECIELAYSPVVGVQWHPEWTATQPEPIFNWLVGAASRRTADELALDRPDRKAMA
ncbi:gamma-glutamyl-gamma-aminobutyrate hydrolase family protein [Marmoricola sp. URHB0036]|uniref:gamma-glutamyl-gamma-aminobutyrate hydrolase family protein n=1 Tax=Marmoricola sp. URHB0036 TaxID=1298863 RepID=UPI0004055509|nr:gamma-glutamyl-gamma-aminobutyrate hydrolase family protein [Marmoricola sp. URHB0036]